MPVPFKRLTKTQQAYLRCIDERGHLQQGWGGYGSTQTVRLLEERGLIRLVRWPNMVKGRTVERWIASMTNAGVAYLAELETRRTDNICGYCGTVEHRATAFTANGSDLASFDRWHPGR